MKFLLISPKNRTVYNFRGDLIKEIIELGYEVIVTGPNYDDVEKIEALGAKFECIPLNKTGVNFMSDIQYMRNLKKLMDHEKPDVTLGYTIKPSIYGAIAAKKAGVKNINSMVTGAGYLFTANTLKSRVLKFIAKFLYKKGLKQTNTVIFQNKDDQKEFVENRLVKKNKTKVVNGSGVNMKHFYKSNYPEKITFFMLSRILYSKGVKEYLEAAKIVKKAHPKVRFMLLGAVENMQDTMNYDVLKSYIDEGTIEHFGETSDVRKYYKQSSVFVLPSYREGTPRTVLEAMSMGRPIITTDVPGCRETVINNKTGFLVPAKNSSKLADAMMTFVNNNHLIEEFGEHSYQYCQDKFEVSKVNKEMLRHLKISKGE